MSTIRERSAEQLSADIHLLGDILGKVIRQQAGVDMYMLEESFRTLAKTRRADDDPAVTDKIRELVEALDVQQADIVSRAFTIYFQLVNLAEDQHRVRVLRGRSRNAYPGHVRESIGDAVQTLWRAGVDETTMQQIVDRMHVEPVFTAHPTEAKRRTILSKLARIAEDLTKLEQTDLLPAEESRIQAHMLAEVTNMWLTAQSRTQKPKVDDEVKTGLYFFETTIWDVVPQVYRAMQIALADYYPRVKMPTKFLSFWFVDRR